MVSVVKKLRCGDENCLRAISYIFVMENLEQKFSELKFNEMKTENYHPKQKKTHLNKNYKKKHLSSKTKIKKYVRQTKN